jgi:hypothetical protein
MVPHAPPVGHRRRNLDDLLEIGFDYSEVLKEAVLIDRFVF